MIRQVFKRDLKLLLQNKKLCLQPVLFFLFVVILIPLGITPQKTVLQMIGSAVIWLGFILANFLVIDNLLQKDFDYGLLEQFILAPKFNSAVWLSKCAAYWVATVFPLIICVPIVAILYNLTAVLPQLLLAIILSTPTLTLCIGLSVSFTLAIENGALLFSILLFPIIAPVSIIATSIVNDVSPTHILPQWYWLAAYLILGITIVPFCMNYVIKESVSK